MPPSRPGGACRSPAFCRRNHVSHQSTFLNSLCRGGAFMTLAEALPQEPRAFVTWKYGKSSHRIALLNGRHLLGNSAFAAVQVGESGTDLCAVLELSEGDAVLRCIGASPTLFVGGHKLSLGASVAIG